VYSAHLLVAVALACCCCASSFQDGPPLLLQSSTYLSNLQSTIDLTAAQLGLEGVHWCCTDLCFNVTILSQLSCQRVNLEVIVCEQNCYSFNVAGVSTHNCTILYPVLEGLACCSRVAFLAPE
jgi:hypothetical protein